MAGEIDPALIKFYYPTVKTEGSAHGGAINTSDEITDATSENLFDNISDAERLAGDTSYRKFFVRNENAATWSAVLGYISQAALASNVTYSIALGTASDTQADASAYTYYTPDSSGHVDALAIGDLAQNASQGIWVKQVTSAAGNGYTDNSAKFGFVSS